MAFFSGNIRLASRIIDDALKLYRKIGNTKAVGVACNNLANTYFATVLNAKIHGIVSELDCSCSDLLAALALYDESVDIADHFRVSDHQAPVTFQQVMDLAGEKLIVAMTSSNMIGLVASTGKEAWKVPFAPSRMSYNSLTPIVTGETVRVSTEDGSYLSRVKTD